MMDVCGIRVVFLEDGVLGICGLQFASIYGPMPASFTLFSYT